MANAAERILINVDNSNFIFDTALFLLCVIKTNDIQWVQGSLQYAGVLLFRTRYIISNHLNRCKLGQGSEVIYFFRL